MKETRTVREENEQTWSIHHIKETVEEDTIQSIASINLVEGQQVSYHFDETSYPIISHLEYES